MLLLFRRVASKQALWLSTRLLPRGGLFSVPVSAASRSWSPMASTAFWFLATIPRTGRKSFRNSRQIPRRLRLFGRGFGLQEQCAKSPRKWRNNISAWCMRRRTRRILFVQATEAGGYPPIVHASTLMACQGWEAMVLNAPISGYTPELPPHPRVTIRNIPPRGSHVLGKTDYFRYLIAASRAAATFQPDVVYASDPAGAAPGLAAAKIARATLIYHEHDTPNPGALNRQVAKFRRAAAKSARVVIFPNET